MIKSIFLVFALVFSLNATQTDDLKAKFEKTTEKVIKVVQNKELKADDRNSKIVETITPMFDFELMAKLSLGKKWKELNPEAKEKFVGLYVNRMKQSYSSKVDKYTDEKIVVNSVKQVKANRMVLNTSLVGADNSTEVIYKFYLPKTAKENKDKWLAYDVVIAGVSIIKTDKAQFKAVLKESSIYELMDKLER